MLTAILVDDDYPVIRYLSQAIDWETIGLQLIGSYANGQEAWEAAGAAPPDIIITDIGMPKMNGLEMLEKFNAVNPKVRSVVLSCHNEFAFAQRALKLNADDYILKESMDAGQLQDILSRIADELGQELQQEADMVSYRQMESMNQTAIKEKFLKDTLFQSSWAKNDWLAKARSLGIGLNAGCYIPVVIVIDRMPHIARTRRMNEYTLAFAVENVIQDMLDSSRWVAFRYGSKQLVLLYRCEDPGRERQTAHYEMLEAMETVKRLLKFTITGIIGKEARSPKDIQSALMPVLSEEACLFYWKEGALHRYMAIDFSREDIYTHYADLFSSINTSAALHQPELMRSAIGSWLSEVRMRQYHPSAVKEFILQLLFELQMKVKTTLQCEGLMDGEKLYDSVHEIGTMDHLEEWLAHYLDDLSKKLGVYTVGSKRQEVIRAQQYVNSNVTEKISLEDMAKLLNLNASYFSRLFKRETNQNFIEYVNMIKLQKAKELLQHTNKSVEEISDYLGYANKSYFIKLFKREMGMKPSEYANWR
ncbi:response regulator [Paenibacillus sp. J5C_2022]|uniref:response regulator transcription factor n=1 Tax=Paenibacillus sp. J5C2022 TaxID=2977129 RepID=UPI0021D2DECC|nr:helix-turn-helix domain-containing protein [Paenibacillus sp. J5C2022]MCU6711572.1 response regulator [Paenibacillus sp. J5C2022]